MSRRYYRSRCIVDLQTVSPTPQATSCHNSTEKAKNGRRFEDILILPIILLKDIRNQYRSGDFCLSEPEVRAGQNLQVESIE